MKIDAEVHFWKYDKSISLPLIRNNNLLHQHYLPEQLSQSLHRNGIQGCMAVVSEELEVETRFLSELAITHPEIKGVVGWMDLLHPNAGEKMKELHQYAAVKGFRFHLKDGALPSQEVMELLGSYQYNLDLVFLPGTGLQNGERFIQSNPGQSFVLPNCGYPGTAGAPGKEWVSLIQSLAKNQNLYCKVAGLLTGGIDAKSWKPADLFPFLDLLFDAFGVERLMFASDWPFLLVSGIYVQWKSLLEKYTEKFSPEDQARFFGENAARLYRL